MGPLTPPLREVWQAKAYPRAVAGGRILAHVDHHVVALSARTGKRLWSYPWRASDVYAHRDVVVANVWDGDELHVIDAATGRPQRVFPSPSAYAAAMAGDALVAHDAKYGPGMLFCADVTTGVRRWRRPSAEVKAWTAGAEVCVFALATGELLALRTSTGEVLWRREWPPTGSRDGEVGSATIDDVRLGDGAVFVTVGEHFLGLDLATGETRWKNGNDGARHQVVEGRRIFSLSGHRYRVLDAATGHAVVERDVGPSLPERLREHGFHQMPLLSETHLFAASNRDALAAFARDTGEHVWSWQSTRSGSMSAPFAAEGRVCLGISEHIHCFEPVPRKGSA
jgi:outer membrane protein assembly factor BamB